MSSDICFSECYMMSRSFYIDNQCFFNPYNLNSGHPQGIPVPPNPDTEGSADAADVDQPKLDL